MAQLEKVMGILQITLDRKHSSLNILLNRYTTEGEKGLKTIKKKGKRKEKGKTEEENILTKENRGHAYLVLCTEEQVRRALEVEITGV